MQNLEIIFGIAKKVQKSLEIAIDDEVICGYWHGVRWKVKTFNRFLGLVMNDSVEY